jgi:hypothetical protein
MALQWAAGVLLATAKRILPHHGASAVMVLQAHLE